MVRMQKYPLFKVMPYLRCFQHFMTQKRVYQQMVKLTIANFFAIVLQYNSNFRIVLQLYSKKKNIFYFTVSFLSIHSLLSSLFSLLYSLFRPNTISSLSSFSLPSLLGPVFGSLVVVRGWVVGPVFGSWVTAWVSSGCGLWIGVVVGCGLWIGVVGSWSWIGELG